MKIALITFILTTMAACWMLLFPKDRVDILPPASIRSNDMDKLIDVGGFRLHIRCTGNDNPEVPTVVFDSGLNQSYASWMLVQREVEKFAHVCSYDRAGHGLSDLGPKPRTSKNIAKELHTLLHKAEIHGPYLLVGHSFGGINVRTFAALYPNEVMGMVLVDTSHEDQKEKMDLLPWPKPMLKDRIINFFATKINYLGHMKIKKEIQKWPKPELFSLQEWQYLLSLMSQYNDYVATVNEAKSIDVSFAELKKMNKNLGDKPLIVITHGKVDESTNDNKELIDVIKQADKIQDGLHKELLQFSSNSEQMIAHKSGHMIPHDQPEIIVEAIKKMILQLQDKS